jgi:hypothetical protein
MGHERRRAPRYHLVLEAEISSPYPPKPLKARTSDVSLLGCFMNTPYSLPAGTDIQLQLAFAGGSFRVAAAVVRSEPSMGFGVSFGAMKGGQQALLQKWLVGAALA